MNENGAMSELLPGGPTVNVAHSTTSWTRMHVHATGSDACISSGLLKPAVERRRQRGRENKGACASAQEVKSMTSHWLKSMRAALLGAPQ